MKFSIISVLTPEESIISFNVYRLPNNKSLKDCDIVRCGECVLVYDIENQKLYGSGKVPTDGYSYSGFRWNFLPDFVNCLYRLGLVFHATVESTTQAYESYVKSYHEEIDKTNSKHLLKRLGRDKVNDLLNEIENE